MTDWLTHSLNELMNDKAVCRTAPAKPGLSKIPGRDWKITTNVQRIIVKITWKNWEYINKIKIKYLENKGKNTKKVLMKWKWSSKESE